MRLRAAFRCHDCPAGLARLSNQIAEHLELSPNDLAGGIEGSGTGSPRWLDRDGLFSIHISSSSAVQRPPASSSVGTTTSSGRLSRWAMALATKRPTPSTGAAHQQTIATPASLKKFTGECGRLQLTHAEDVRGMGG